MGIDVKSQEFWDRSYFCKKSYSKKTDGGGSIFFASLFKLYLNVCLYNWNLYYPILIHSFEKMGFKISDI